MNAIESKQCHLYLAANTLLGSARSVYNEALLINKKRCSHTPEHIIDPSSFKALTVRTIEGNLASGEASLSIGKVQLFHNILHMLPALRIIKLENVLLPQRGKIVFPSTVEELSLANLTNRVCFPSDNCLKELKVGCVDLGSPTNYFYLPLKLKYLEVELLKKGIISQLGSSKLELMAIDKTTKDSGLELFGRIEEFCIGEEHGWMILYPTFSVGYMLLKTSGVLVVDVKGGGKYASMSLSDFLSFEYFGVSSEELTELDLWHSPDHEYTVQDRADLAEKLSRYINLKWLNGNQAPSCANIDLPALL